MSAPEVVRRYAVTLLEAAREKGVRLRVEQDVEDLLATLRDSPDLVGFLGDRLTRPGLHRQVLQQVFAGRVQPLTLNFLLLLAQRRRVHLLPAVLEAFRELALAQAGIVRAQVRSALELSAEQEGRLGERLSAFTGKRVRLHVQVDGSLRGGLVARVGDVVFDGTVASQLERLRRRLMGR
ncbi:MAG: ATP synthase F1 subunit delta [Candidatus Latescibacterota bacterium]